MDKRLKKYNGITLIGLVVTIIILLILAGISITSIVGEDGILSKTIQAKNAHIGEEIREQFILAIQELQLEKQGKATLDDVTQEWIDEELPQYKNRVIDDASMNGKKVTIRKDDVIKRFLIDENLNITDITSQGSIDFSYIVQDRVDNKVNILIYVQDIENGLKQIEFLDTSSTILLDGTKDEKIIDYEVEIGKEYKVKVISENGKIKEETILLDSYWYKITMDLSEGVSVDNDATKVEYNKPYQATIKKEDGYIWESIKVIMGETEIIVNKTTGIIEIQEVTENIQIIATALELKFKEVSSGKDHNLALDISNNLWAWGSDSNGKLGNGAQKASETPIQIRNETKFKEISAQNQHSLAIDESGNLWAWGSNSTGQLGDGTIAYSTEPIQIKDGTKFSQVSGGDAHSLAIDESGNLWAWGDNNCGRLGDGTTTNQTTPVKIKSGTKFKEISAGYGHSLAIDESGNLWAWGYNYYGQLGDGTTTNQTTPVKIKSGTKFIQVSGGLLHSLAIDESGNIWAWGYNSKGQLGDGTTTNQTAPVKIKSGTKFSKVSSGEYYSSAIDDLGNICTWGYNSEGQLGDGNTIDSTEPVKIN